MTPQVLHRHYLRFGFVGPHPIWRNLANPTPTRYGRTITPKRIGNFSAWLSGYRERDSAVLNENVEVRPPVFFEQEPIPRRNLVGQSDGADRPILGITRRRAATEGQRNAADTRDQASAA